MPGSKSQFSSETQRRHKDSEVLLWNTDTRLQTAAPSPISPVQRGYCIVSVRASLSYLGRSGFTVIIFSLIINSAINEPLHIFHTAESCPYPTRFIHTVTTLPSRVDWKCLGISNIPIKVKSSKAVGIVSAQLAFLPLRKQTLQYYQRHEVLLCSQYTEGLNLIQSDPCINSRFIVFFFILTAALTP